jgi:hypothetical protein
VTRSRRPMAHRLIDPHTAPMTLAEKIGAVIVAIEIIAVLYAAVLFLPDRLS